MKAQEISIEIPFSRLAARAWGSPAAKHKILALHGWLDNAASFDPLAPLIENSYIVAVDLPGHGLSEHKHEAYVYHFVDAVADVLAIIDSLGWNSCILMGHSMGAGVAALVAPTAPEYVEALVMLEGLGPLSLEGEHVIDRMQSHLRQLRRLAKKKFPVYKSFDEAVAARKGAAIGISEAAARLICARSLRELPGGGLTWTSDPRLRMKTPTVLTEGQVQGFVKGIKCPSFFMRAQPGFEFSEQILRDRRALVENCVYHEIGGDHHVHMDKAPEIATWINAFLAKL